MQQQAQLSQKQKIALYEKKFRMQQELVERHLNAHDMEEEEDVETDCAVCMNIMIESCLLPCRHRFCI